MRDFCMVMATDNHDVFDEKLYLYRQTEEEKKIDDKIKKRERLIHRSVDCILVSKYLHDYLFPEFEYLENSIAPDEKRQLNHQLEIKERVARQTLEISLENRNLEEILFAKKIHLRDSIKKRNESWNKAVKVFNGVSEKPSISPIMSKEADTSEDAESISSVSEGYKEKNISPERIKKEIQEKYLFIQEISSILHRLIVFSGIKWAQQKNLLDIVLCTGKILNTTFNKHNPKEFEKFVIDCMQRLNQVNWKHIK